MLGEFNMWLANDNFGVVTLFGFLAEGFPFQWKLDIVDKTKNWHFGDGLASIRGSSPIKSRITGVGVIFSMYELMRVSNASLSISQDCE